MVLKNQRKLALLHILNEEPNLTASEVCERTNAKIHNVRNCLTNYYLQRCVSRRGKYVFHYKITEIGKGRLSKLKELHKQGKPLNLQRRASINV